MHIAVIDIGKPGANLGWAIDGSTREDGTDLEDAIKHLSTVLRSGPLALGFEAPMFVPFRTDMKRLTAARAGECINGISRPFSAGAGAAVTVTALTVVPYVLRRLRALVPDATATLDWTSMPTGPERMLLFEAFVTNQRKTADTRHVEDAHKAIAAFRRALTATGKPTDAIAEPECLNLLGAMMLRTGWSHESDILAKSCLVVRA